MYKDQIHETIYGYLDYIEANPDEFNEEHRLLPDFIRNVLDDPDVYLDNDMYVRIMKFYDKYVPFEFMPWQKFVIAFVYAVYKDYENEIMLFNRFFIYMGRGGGKNGFITALAMGLQTNIHGVRNYDIDIIANSERQAKTSFDELYDWIDYDRDLEPAFYKTKTEITFLGTNSTLGYRTANPKTADGGRQGALVFDEIHYFEDYDLINVYESGMGKKAKPKYFYISSDGYIRGGVLDDKKESGRDILMGIEPHNGTLYIPFSLDNPNEAGDPSKWVKANPRLKYDKQFADEFYNLYYESRKSSQRMAEFMTKRFNLPTMAEEDTIASIEDVRRCNRPLPLEELKDIPAIGAVDFSSIRDFCSVGLLFNYDGTYYLKEHTFVHERSLVVDYKFPIEESIANGEITLVETADSPIITADHVIDWFYEQMEEGFTIAEIYADEYRIAHMTEQFQLMGLPITTARSGKITDTKLYPLFENIFAQGRLAWGEGKLMNWYTMNTKVVTDNKGNKRFEKIEPKRRKTDGFSMLCHAFNHYLDEENFGTIDYDLIDYGVF